MSEGRVLVIDDGDDAREFMTRILTDAGHDVVTQASPIGATRTIIRDRIDVVVIDIQMPAMRGDKLARLFRENPRFAGLGVILVSGRPLSELRRIGQEVDADAVIAKSDLARSLAGAVQNVLGLRRAQPPDA